jgi:hypothetical protein
MFLDLLSNGGGREGGRGAKRRCCERRPVIIGGTIKRQFRSGALLLLALARSLPQHKRMLIKSSISTAQLLCVFV